MDIEDIKYDALLAYIENGAQGDLSDDMVKYIELLELIRSMHMRYNNRNAIINFIQQPPYSLSNYRATKLFSQAINFFYLNAEIKKQAWRNLYAEKLDRAADLVLRTATSSKDIDIYKNILYAARDFRQLNVPEAADIPDDFFKKKNKVYILDPKFVGRKRADRNILAKHIDSLDIPETDKDRIKSEGGMGQVNFLDYNLDEDEDSQEN